MGYGYAYMECTEGSKRRFYRLSAQPGLFGPVLIREWGRIGTSGRLMVSPCTDEKELSAAWREHFTTRLRHGYQVVSSFGHLDV